MLIKRIKFTWKRWGKKNNKERITVKQGPDNDSVV